ncbi:MAG: dipeptide epimerase [Bacteroidetes bacterium]|nr:MAG: dipeptide epimerase [Bacteroidota bacterium]
MKITRIHAWRKNLALTRPYSIAGYTFSDVENVFLEIELENGITGIGAASPAEEVVGESCEMSFRNLTSPFFEQMTGRDIRHFRQLISEAATAFPNLPGTQAAFDIALHDAFGKYLGIPVVEFYGQKIRQLPTSVTLGILSLEDTLATAGEYRKLGFKVLKIKTGEDPEQDIERLRALSLHYKKQFTIRVDANQGYSLGQLQQVLAATESIGIELTEQPLAAGRETELLSLSEVQRRRLAADESLKDERAALRLSQLPQPFGIFNIKLMKCGGIVPALEIATIARHAGIDLFWGCNDESIVSITAALHAAFACPHTRYLDLDGSFDLAEDIVSGGFVMENGCLRIAGGPGLGVVRR